ncbi:hypothetical protein [Halalkalirubrum salinum]|uniref:hypothetical protein n=1 Tax=Halalkalirubrum salinum TaxID=2563889 RepID=UPI00197AB0FA|nr:hypothetical protein [Halalkalirubrum salinum]
MQFYVVDRGLAEVDELMNHDDAFEYEIQAGVFSEATKDKLIELWQTYRNGTYYQQERATAEQAKRCWHTPSAYTNTFRNSPVGHTMVSVDEKTDASEVKAGSLSDSQALRLAAIAHCLRVICESIFTKECQN